MPTRVGPSSLRISKPAFPTPTSAQLTLALARRTKMTAAAPVNAAKPDEKYGWALSDKVKPELVKQDVWSVFSPASGASHCLASLRTRAGSGRRRSCSSDPPSASWQLSRSANADTPNTE